MYIQTTHYYELVGSKRLAHTCPDCGKAGCLELLFYQKRTETLSIIFQTKKVSGILFCHHTQTEIAPVQWSDTIENQFIAEKRNLKLLPRSFGLKKFFYIVIGLIILLILGIVGFVKWEKNRQNEEVSVLTNMSKGGQVEVMLTYLENGQVASYGNTWLSVQKMEGDTIWLQRHRDFTTGDADDFDLAPSNFTDEVFKCSYPDFKNKSLHGFDYRSMSFSGFIINVNKQEL